MKKTMTMKMAKVSKRWLRGVSFALALIIMVSGGMILNSASTDAKVKTKYVALTFDDGPSTVTTKTALKALKKYDAHATFFVVGNRVASGKKYIKKAIEQGCEIASHSWDHTNLAKLSLTQVNKHFEKTAKAVKKAADYDVKLLRPPYGAVSTTMKKKFEHPMILWDVDTLDWKYRNTPSIMKYIKREVNDGSIILMHDIHKTSVDSLNTVLKWLKKHHYEVVTVSELAAIKGVELDKGVYCNIK